MTPSTSMKFSTCPIQFSTSKFHSPDYLFDFSNFSKIFSKQPVQTFEEAPRRYASTGKAGGGRRGRHRELSFS